MHCLEIQISIEKIKFQLLFFDRGIGGNSRFMVNCVIYAADVFHINTPEHYAQVAKIFNFSSFVRMVGVHCLRQTKMTQPIQYTTD